MSLIPLVAYLIRQAAYDSEAAQDFYDAALASGQTRDLVGADIEDQELDELNPTEWQWYAGWRQELGGDLNPTLIQHLTQVSMSRYSRFKLRRLILRDPPTNRYAAERVDAGEPPYGAIWLTEQAGSAQVAQATELMDDALQCATDASWFLLNQLTTVGEYRGTIARTLTAFAEARGITSGLRQRWGLEG
ncbi:hypothetical protein [[Mycobacterium] crassicus]|uniref:Uncharacterized protein n=1 Tax=[Mycobacterium] crassicus TaxID=2872309 RepID=A0ABU5XR48_9MYCO|nr:hypothetical protein [Mycolicibacter sp. MYC098]MEB3023561.1 hypothetical protein [Mycolicibacter sp. MYC098]